MRVVYFLFFCTFISVSSTIEATTYWNWHTIATNDTHFPQTFQWGTTTLAHEVEGYSKNSTWYAWEPYIKDDGQPFVMTRSGNAIHHTKNYKNDIQLMKKIGITTYCFSVDWSRIEPEQGLFDHSMLQYYDDFCHELVENNIKPFVILKAHCDPLWFGYLGGFEKEKNIYLFERYCLEVVKKLQLNVDHFVTLWAPEAYAMLGYLAGTIPPGKKNMQSAATVLKNELEAHVRAYIAIKKLPNSSTKKIGIVKHVHPLEPWHFWDRATCYAAKMINDTSFYSFFTTGNFSIKIPIPGKSGAWVTHINSYAPQSLDFVGINYYGHGYMKNLFNHVSNPNEIATDVAGITIYPEGLYSAIKEVSDNVATKLNIPLYITQNGVATTDESVRDLYLKRHLYATSKAIKDGYNVQGYFYYSLLDCFSWGSFDKKFGLCAVDRVTHQRTPKTGSQYYCDIIKKHRK